MTRGPIKILHVFSRMIRGGAEMRTFDLMRHLDRRSYRFHFCALSGKPGELDDEIHEAGGDIHLLRFHRPGFSGRFRRLLRKHAFDVVHAHVHYSSGLLMRVAAQCGTRVRVTHFRNSEDGRGANLPRQLWRQVMRRWVDCHATHVLAVSEGAMQAAWNADWESDPRCSVIYNGLPTTTLDAMPDRVGVRREFGFPDNGPLSIHVGRMARQKNHPRLLEIFASVLKRCPTANLLLVGEGDEQIAWDTRLLARRLGVDGRIAFAGGRADVPRLLAASDVLILPSLWEGLPGVVLEACAVGTPVVASRLSGVCEIADRLPHVRPMSLESSDDQWAEAVVDRLTGESSPATRQHAQDRFTTSVFTVQRSAEMACRVWRGTPSDQMTGGAAHG